MNWDIKNTPNGSPIAVYTSMSAHSVLMRSSLTMSFKMLTVPRRIGIMMPIDRYRASRVFPLKSYSTRAKAATAERNTTSNTVTTVTMKLFRK